MKPRIYKTGNRIMVLVTVVMLTTTGIGEKYKKKFDDANDT